MKYFFILSIISIISLLGATQKDEPISQKSPIIIEGKIFESQLDETPQGIPVQLIEFTNPMIIVTDAGM